MNVQQLIIGGVAAFMVSTGFLAYGCPKYKIYSREMTGKAELAQAESNRKIAILEAEAKRESAKALASAEVERAKGVAEANKIIGDSLHGNDIYLKYLWIQSLSEGQHKEVVYVPTETNLPILEATRLEDLKELPQQHQTPKH